MRSCIRTTFCKTYHPNSYRFAKSVPSSSVLAYEAAARVLPVLALQVAAAPVPLGLDPQVAAQMDEKADSEEVLRGAVADVAAVPVLLGLAPQVAAHMQEKAVVLVPLGLGPKVAADPAGHGCASGVLSVGQPHRRLTRVAAVPAPRPLAAEDLRHWPDRPALSQFGRLVVHPLRERNKKKCFKSVVRH